MRNERRQGRVRYGRSKLHFNFTCRKLYRSMRKQDKNRSNSTTVPYAPLDLSDTRTLDEREAVPHTPLHKPVKAQVSPAHTGRSKQKEPVLQTVPQQTVSVWECV